MHRGATATGLIPLTVNKFRAFDDLRSPTRTVQRIADGQPAIDGAQKCAWGSGHRRRLVLLVASRVDTAARTPCRGRVEHKALPQRQNGTARPPRGDGFHGQAVGSSRRTSAMSRTLVTMTPTMNSACRTTTSQVQ